MEVPTNETNDEELVESHFSIIIEGKLRVSPNYHLARDRGRSEIVPLHMYNYVDIICYALMWLKNCKI